MFICCVTLILCLHNFSRAYISSLFWGPAVYWDSYVLLLGSLERAVLLTLCTELAAKVSDKELKRQLCPPYSLTGVRSRVECPQHNSFPPRIFNIGPSSRISSLVTEKWTRR